MSKKYKPGQMRCLTLTMEAQEAQERIMNDLNLFDIEFNGLFRWRGNGCPDDSRSPHIWTSFCQVIIANELATGWPWIIFVDQGQDTGTSITNSLQWLVPRVCKKFTLDIFNLRVFEIYLHKESPSYSEIDVKGVFFHDEIPKINADWKPCNERVLASLEKVLRLAGDGGIDQNKGIVVGPR